MAKGTRNTGGILVGAISIVALAAIVVVVIAVSDGARTGNPFTGRALYTYYDSSAAKAIKQADDAEQLAAFTELAGTPTAVWLTPELHPTAEITQFVGGIGADAAAESKLPVFVVYGIPSRDCGNFSAGGASARDYPLWISAIGQGIGDRPAVVILEPDALALAPSCQTEDATVGFLRDAIRRLSRGTDTTIYLDGGHSSWLPPAEMAPLLVAAGVDKVRGFATNVSNFNTTADEREYATALSALVGGSHFVIDTSRNGNGTNGEWCNPSGRKIGATPTGADDSSPQDAILWIKNPGESDGDCNGGPPAGQWWPERAVELVRGG